MTQPTPNTELRAFLLVLRQALLVIVRYVEKNYMDNKSATPVVEFGAQSSTNATLEP